jgi:integrase
LRFLTEDQIDGDVWTIPGDAMTGRKDATADYRVPLSIQALTVIKQAQRRVRDGFLFPSIRKGVISDATLSRLMERRGMEARPHGFRTSMLTWFMETQNIPLDHSEMLLAHKVGNKVSQAYARSDLLDLRRQYLGSWARFVTSQSGKILDGEAQ